MGLMVPTRLYLEDVSICATAGGGNQRKGGQAEDLAVAEHMHRPARHACTKSRASHPAPRLTFMVCPGLPAYVLVLPSKPLTNGSPYTARHGQQR